MQIDENLLNKLEKLSALRIANERRVEVINQLSEIVDFMERLNELDLNSSQITISTIEGGTPLRRDEVKTSKVVDEVLQNAPKSNEHFFTVPKIIECD